MNASDEPPASLRLNLLAVSLAYPPLAYPRSIQVARLLKFVNAATVLACADESEARKDATIDPEAERFLAACIRVRVRTSGRRRLADRLAYRFNRPLWKRRTMSPDNYGDWKTDVLDEIGRFKIANNYAPDAIVTFAQPFTDHLIGLELQRRYQVPWLAHFSDPWADNPFSGLDERSRAINLELERRVVEAADILAFTSAETVDLVMSKYSTELGKKARVLPQCFDPSLFVASKLSADSPITIRYLGNFYGGRTAAPLVRGLTAIVKDDVNILRNVRFELVGVNDAAMLGNAGHENLPPGLLTVIPSVPYRESLRLMSGADGLLIIDAPAKTSVFLPSKLIDYIGAGRPVMGITPPGAAAGLIGEIGGIVADPADPDAVRSSLCAFIETLRARREGHVETAWGDPAARDRFEARRVAKDFEDTVREMIV